MQHEYKLRDLFLSSFVESLIKNSYKPNISDQIKQSIEYPQQKKPIEPVIPKIQKPIMKTPSPQISTQRPLLRPIQKQLHLQMPRTLQPMTKQQRPPQKEPRETTEKVNLGKINSILNDPSVFSLESPGPNKNIIINRAGQIQPSSLSLTKEEIDTMMKEISDITRIPLIYGGVFKAAFRDLIITAVISEYIGTRFLIQKRNPFQRY